MPQQKYWEAWNIMNCTWRLLKEGKLDQARTLLDKLQPLSSEFTQSQGKFQGKIMKYFTIKKKMEKIDGHLRNGQLYDANCLLHQVLLAYHPRKSEQYPGSDPRQHKLSEREIAQKKYLEKLKDQFDSKISQLSKIENRRKDFSPTREDVIPFDSSQWLDSTKTVPQLLETLYLFIATAIPSSLFKPLLVNPGPLLDDQQEKLDEIYKELWEKEKQSPEKRIIHARLFVGYLRAQFKESRDAAAQMNLT